MNWCWHQNSPFIISKIFSGDFMTFIFDFYFFNIHNILGRFILVCITVIDLFIHSLSDITIAVIRRTNSNFNSNSKLTVISRSTAVVYAGILRSTNFQIKMLHYIIIFRLFLLLQFLEIKSM